MSGGKNEDMGLHQKCVLLKHKERKGENNQIEMKASKCL